MDQDGALKVIARDPDTELSAILDLNPPRLCLDRHDPLLTLAQPSQAKPTESHPIRP
jgi:hypothetical protein